MNKYRYMAFLFISMLFFASCEKNFGDINVNPDEPTAVPPNVLLTVAEAQLAYTMGGDASRFAGLFTQHIDGVGRQFVVFHQYNIIGSDLDGMWANMYTAVLQNLNQVILASEESQYNHYIGIAKALQAYSYMFLTDMFGDVPMSEALIGTSVLQPKFDSQSEVYTGVFGLLDEARTLLGQDDGGLSVGNDDFIYGGDIAAWNKFCNVLEARGRLHLAKMDSANYQRALDALARGSFASRDDDARFQFNALATEAAPWFQYLEQRTDTDVGDSYVALMESLNDPRVATYGFKHTPAGDHPILTQDRNYPLLTYTEAKFIEAECIAKISGDANPAFEAAIASSFEDAKVTGHESYISSLGGATLENIAIQKYIAMFNDPEAFNDWRRTGIPALTPNVGTEVPRKFPYAETEILSNSNTPSLGLNEIFTRVWWDQ